MEIDKKQFKIYDWKHPGILHWLINPGCAIVELVFGQRVAKISLLDRESDKPLFERTYVPCPHCNTLHDGRTWSFENGTATKNWFGLYCPKCGEIIPCLMNFTSMIILGLSFPVWGWFRTSLKKSWLKVQPARFSTLDIEHTYNPYKGTGWIGQGLATGFLFFVWNILVSPYFSEKPHSWEIVRENIVPSLLLGLSWGFIMKIYFSKRGSKRAEA